VRPDTINLLIKEACFLTKIKKIEYKHSWSKLASTRRPMVLSLSLHKEFPAKATKLLSDKQECFQLASIYRLVYYFCMAGLFSYDLAENLLNLKIQL
jgi:hypothetical protein